MKTNVRIGGTLQNNKGFTLIELLAVIVILAIIALIATPIILNVINNAKDSSNQRSIELYGEAIEQAVSRHNLSSSSSLIGNLTPNADGTVLTKEENGETITINVEYSGNKVVCKNTQVKSDGTIYLGKCSVNGTEVDYNTGEMELFVEKPNLYNNTLTPVEYDGENWKIVKESSDWYDYENQEWANAVILKSDSTKKVGDTVTVDGTNSDILAMYVWIPRYEYKIDGTYGKGGTSKTSPGEIEVNFISLGQEATEGYRIHPAFTFNNKEISGIWVGKFELSYINTSGSYTSTSLGCTDENCANADRIRILPNVVSLRSNTVSSFFYAVRSMSRNENPFGIDASKIDTHMMKNSEWGAVAYLSQSKYGKYGNDDYTGANKEVYINNSNGIYTGRSGGSYGGNTAVNTVYTDQPDVTTQHNSTGFYTYDGYLLEYNSNTKTTTRDLTKVASTTGNITGIYDMSGGSWEYVMGVFGNSEGYKWSGNSSTANSGFSGKVGTAGDDYEGLSWPDEKYFEVYKASSGTTISSTTACSNGICYGHGLSETAGWYGDYSSFVSASNPWFERGGYCGNGSYSGVFGSNNYIGIADGYFSARAVLSPTT